MATPFAHNVRSLELELTVPYLPAGGSVLELGAGDGWQSSDLARRGFDVTAVDIPPARPHATRFFPVSHYDGRSLPFADHSFDAVYSSSVLEHVADFEGMQAELARVLRPGGIAVHCLPTGVWRFWTSATHPLYAARWAFRSLRRTNGASAGSAGPGARKSLWQGILPPRHGEHGNLLTEHWLFTRGGWDGRFRGTRWEITHVLPMQLFYTGNEVLGLALGNAQRARLATLLGSSTIVYVVRPARRS